MKIARVFAQDQSFLANFTFKLLYLGKANSDDIFAHNFQNIYAVFIIKYFLETRHLWKHFSIYIIFLVNENKF